MANRSMRTSSRIYFTRLTQCRSAVIDWLNEPCIRPITPVIHYYVDAARVRPPTASEILHALVKQFVAYYLESDLLMPKKLFDEVAAICNTLNSTPTSLTILTAVVQHFLRLQPFSFLVVDGIDSMLESEIMIFIRSLRHIWDPQLKLISQSKLILSCRETLGRRIRLENIPCSTVLQISLKHLQSDIHLYVDNEVDTRQTENPITDNNALIDEVKKALKSNSEKM